MSMGDFLELFEEKRRNLHQQHASLLIQKSDTNTKQQTERTSS